MDLFIQYQKERRNRETFFVSNRAFATYEIKDRNCYIVDTYVHPDFRKSGVASQMADDIAKIAKEKGCTTLSGTVDLTANGGEVNCMGMLRYGFKFEAALDNILYFKKEI